MQALGIVCFSIFIHLVWCEFFPGGRQATLPRLLLHNGRPTMPTHGLVTPPGIQHSPSIHTPLTQSHCRPYCISLTIQFSLYRIGLLFPPINHIGGSFQSQSRPKFKLIVQKITESSEGMQENNFKNSNSAGIKNNQLNIRHSNSAGTRQAFVILTVQI